MKLNYTSLQHAVLPVEDERVDLPLERPVGVLALHGHWLPSRGPSHRPPPEEARIRAERRGCPPGVDTRGS